MNTCLFYFTGTGNTLAAARALADRLGNCTIKSVISELKKSSIILDETRIGLCFPLYFLSFPEPVLEFIERMEVKQGAEVFAVVTRGLSPMGGALSHLKKLLKAKSVRFSAGFYITMPNNDLTLFKADSALVQNRKLQNVAVEIERISSKLKRGKQWFQSEPFGWLRPLRYKRAYLNHLEDFGKKFYVSENCNGCGVCRRICPVENISIQHGKPLWAEGCVLCEGCLNWCPSEAIQFGKATAGKKRYHHPQITSKDIEMQR